MKHQQNINSNVFKCIRPDLSLLLIKNLSRIMFRLTGFLTKFNEASLPNYLPRDGRDLNLECFKAEEIYIYIYIYIYI